MGEALSPEHVAMRRKQLADALVSKSRKFNETGDFAMVPSLERQVKIAKDKLGMDVDLVTTGDSPDSTYTDVVTGEGKRQPLLPNPLTGAARSIRVNEPLDPNNPEHVRDTRIPVAPAAPAAPVAAPAPTTPAPTRSGLMGSLVDTVRRITGGKK